MRSLLLLVLAGGPAAPPPHAPHAALPLDSVVVAELVWSPDGRHLAFGVRSRNAPCGAAACEVWIADAAGAEPARPLDVGHADAHAPAFSPDGRVLSFLARADDGAAPQLYLLPLDGGRARRLTSAGAGVEAYAWVPDGTAVVFTARAGAGDAPEPTGAHLWRVDIVEGTTRRLTEGAFHVSGPAVSPDGLWVAHERSPIGRRGERRATDLWLVPISGGAGRRLTTHDGPDRDPRWSPDGRGIAYRSMSKDGRGRLRLVRLDGRPPSDLTDPADPPPGPPIWTRDGRLIFVAGHGAGRIISIPADPVLRGRDVRTLAEDRSGVGGIALSPDGGRLAFVRREDDATPEVHVLRPAVRRWTLRGAVVEGETATERSREGALAPGRGGGHGRGRGARMRGGWR